MKDVCLSRWVLFVAGWILIASTGCWGATVKAPLLLFPIKVIAIDPKTPTTVYIGTLGGGIFKSIDGGDTWTRAQEGLTDPLVKAIAIDPSNTQWLYAGTENGGVFQSMNGGVIWFPSGASITTRDVTSLVVDPNSCQAPPCTTVYLGTLGGGVFRTTNRGVTWEAVNKGLTDLSVTAMAVFPDLIPVHLFVATENGRIFMSEDQGEHWKELGSPAPPGEVFSLVADPHKPSILYLGMAAGGGGYRSTTGGINWDRMMQLHPHPDEETIIVIDPRNPLILYASSLEGVSKSEDGGDTWRPSNAGLPPEAVDVHSLALTGTTLYAGTFTGKLFKSTDGGATWTELTVTQ